MSNRLPPAAVAGPHPTTTEQLRAAGPTVNLRTAAAALGMARQTAERMVAAGSFPVRVIVLPQARNKYRVPTAELLALLGIER